MFSFSFSSKYFLIPHVTFPLTCYLEICCTMSIYLGMFQMSFCYWFFLIDSIIFWEYILYDHLMNLPCALGEKSTLLECSIKVDWISWLIVLFSFSTSSLILWGYLKRSVEETSYSCVDLFLLSILLAFLLPNKRLNSTGALSSERVLSTGQPGNFWYAKYFN